MLLLRPTWRLFAGALAASAVGCTAPESVGKLVGAYRIEGALVENGCGSAAVPAADPLRFGVEVRLDDKGRGYWLLAMPPAHSGRLDDDGDFVFELESSFDIGANAGTAEPPEVQTTMDIEALADPERFVRDDQVRNQACRLLITERVSGQLLRKLDPDAGTSVSSAEPALADAEDSDADLVGENEIAFRAGSGSDCAMVLERNGGPFRALPCSVRYEIEGELVEPE